VSEITDQNASEALKFEMVMAMRNGDSGTKDIIVEIAKYIFQQSMRIGDEQVGARMLLREIATELVDNKDTICQAGVVPPNAGMQQGPPMPQPGQMPMMPPQG
jgi:hypothetical protein